MRITLAVAAALSACATHAHGAYFEINQMAVFDRADGMASLTPSSGSFVTQYALPDGENAFLAGDEAGLGRCMVRNDAATWKTSLDDIMASTWLTVDRFGPRGHDGSAAYGTGWYEQKPTLPAGSPPVSVPEGSRSIGGPGLVANGNNGDPVNGDGLSPGFFATEAGFAWWHELGEFSPSGPSVINGVRKQSLFIGHFVLSDPNATLVGNPLLAFFWPTSPGPEADGIYDIPLDGSRGFDPASGTTVPFWLEYERITFTNSLGTFTALDMYLVPAPGVGASLLCLLALARRRR